ncbi:MAG: hypothetical protein JSS53_08485, partial [Proteobacteria bacterium]|nr:hypothetical protein [Pseudomonadota bacterium]
AFGLILNEVISILNNNLKYLCQEDEGIVIVGLQPAGCMIRSQKPEMLKRYIDQELRDTHLCCTLEYLIRPIHQLNDVLHWNHTQSVIVDFTSGLVMDNEQYLAQLNLGKKVGMTFGRINSDILRTTWQIIKIRRKQKLIQRALQQMESKFLEEEEA